MGVGIEQGLVLVLAVQVDQPGAEFAERGGGHEFAVDERAASPLGGHLAPNEQFAAVTVVEHRLDRRHVRPGSNQVGGRAAAEQQAHRLDQNRLARSRLARQDAQSPVELDLDRFDDGQVADG